LGITINVLFNHLQYESEGGGNNAVPPIMPLLWS
jgi:hypothetical protein